MVIWVCLLHNICMCFSFPGGPLDLMSRRVVAAGTHEMANYIVQQLQPISYERDDSDPGVQKWKSTSISSGFSSAFYLKLWNPAAHCPVVYSASLLFLSRDLARNTIFLLQYAKSCYSLTCVYVIIYTQGQLYIFDYIYSSYYLDCLTVFAIRGTRPL